MLILIEIVLEPFFVGFFHGLEGVILDFVLRGVDIFLLDVVLFGKTI